MNLLIYIELTIYVVIKKYKVKGFVVLVKSKIP